MPKIRLVNVRKIYGSGKVAVDNVSLEVDNKEFFVIVGPTGCGKSTLLRLIAGLEEPSQGKIWIDDTSVYEGIAKLKSVTMIFQCDTLFPSINIFNNMAFGLKLRQYPKREISLRVTEAAEILGIKELLKEKPTQISGGQRQKVVFGRALARKPSLFLLDEPLSHLDPNARVQIRDEIIKLRPILKDTTFIYVTHDMLEAMSMGNRIAVMKEGKFIQVDSPQAVYNSPLDTYVAKFFGPQPMNFIEGVIIQKEQKLFFDEGTFKLKIEERIQEAVSTYVNSAVILGIRAEDIHDKSFIDESSAENIVSVTPIFHEFLGPDIVLHLNTGRHTIRARIGAYYRSDITQKTEVVFNMSKAHFFDKKTWKKIV